MGYLQCSYQRVHLQACARMEGWGTLHISSMQYHKKKWSFAQFSNYTNKSPFLFQSFSSSNWYLDSIKEKESEMDQEFGVSRCKLLHLECISDEVLLYSKGNYIQSLGTEPEGR